MRLRFSSRRGQLNFEYLAITGAILAILVPVLYTSLSTVQDHYKMTRVDDVTSQLVNKVNDLYKLGPGNKDELHLIIPSGITGAVVAGNEITLETVLGKQNASVRRQTDTFVVGSIDTIQGEYLVPVKVLNHSLVRIGTGPWILDLTPSCIGAPNFANPPNITINGDDFSSTAVLLKNGVPFSSAFYQVINAGTVIFIAHPTEFPIQPPPSGTPYNFTVTDKGKTSNIYLFWVYPSPNLCP